MAPDPPLRVANPIHAEVLHRVVNGRGRIEREYALGSRRVDLLVVWPEGDGRESRVVVECNLVREGRSHARTVE